MPKYVTHNDTDIKVSGSHIGKVMATREQLFHLFGEPSFAHRNCSFHWTVKFVRDNLIVTIYDFKGRNKKEKPDGLIAWDVGGCRNRIPTSRFEKLGIEVVSPLYHRSID